MPDRPAPTISTSKCSGDMRALRRCRDRISSGGSNALDYIRSVHAVSSLTRTDGANCYRRTAPGIAVMTTAARRRGPVSETSFARRLSGGCGSCGCRVEIFVEFDRLAVLEAPEIDLRRLGSPAGALVGPCA